MLFHVIVTNNFITTRALERFVSVLRHSMLLKPWFLTKANSATMTDEGHFPCVILFVSLQSSTKGETTMHIHTSCSICENTFDEIHSLLWFVWLLTVWAHPEHALVRRLMVISDITLFVGRILAFRVSASEFFAWGLNWHIWSAGTLNDWLRRNWVYNPRLNHTANKKKTIRGSNFFPDRKEEWYQKKVRNVTNDL